MSFFIHPSFSFPCPPSLYLFLSLTPFVVSSLSDVPFEDIRGTRDEIMDAKAADKWPFGGVCSALVSHSLPSCFIPSLVLPDLFSSFLLCPAQSLRQPVPDSILQHLQSLLPRSLLTQVPCMEVDGKMYSQVCCPKRERCAMISDTDIFYGSLRHSSPTPES